MLKMLIFKIRLDFQEKTRDFLSTFFVDLEKCKILVVLYTIFHIRKISNQQHCFNIPTFLS